MAQTTLPESLVQAVQKDLADGHYELPILPEVVTQILSAQDRTSVEDLASIVGKDATLVVHLLRIANSPLYAAAAPITTISSAIVRLGVSNLRRVLLLIACRERVFRVPGFQTELREFFQHSVTAAYLAQSVAQLRNMPTEIGFLLGLVQDIGRPILLQKLLEVGRKQQLRVDRTQILAYVESNHSVLGGKAATKWMLPDPIPSVLAARGLGQSSGDPWVEVLAIADGITKLSQNATRFKLDAPADLAGRLRPGEYDELLTRRLRVEESASALM